MINVKEKKSSLLKDLQALPYAYILLVVHVYQQDISTNQTPRCFLIFADLCYSCLHSPCPCSHVLLCLVGLRLACVNLAVEFTENTRGGDGQSATGELSLCDYSLLLIQALFLPCGQQEINELKDDISTALRFILTSLLLLGWACCPHPFLPPRLSHLPRTMRSKSPLKEALMYMLQIMLHNRKIILLLGISFFFYGGKRICRIKSSI